MSTTRPREQAATISIERMGERLAVLHAEGPIDSMSWETMTELLIGAVAEGRTEAVLDLARAERLSAGAARRFASSVDLLLGPEASVALVAPPGFGTSEIEMLAYRRGWPVLSTRATALAVILSAPVS